MCSMKSVALIPIMIVLFCCAKCYSQADNVTIISVLRRYSTDFYYSRELRKSSVNRCDYNRPTYMVEDQQCVKNEDIFDKCRFALNDSLTSNRTIHMPWSRSGRHLDTGITIIDTNQEKSVSLNISLCKISSLEVYRGKLSVYEIEYSGFTLVDRNTIQVDEQKLAYNSSEYAGELFHMKLSCPHGQSQRDCLFFKAGGNTTVTQPKFNCTVPGTLLKHSTDCPPESTTLTVPEVSTDIILNPTQVTRATATNLTVLNERHPSKFEVGSRLFYAVVGAGGGMVMLLVCCLCCVCVVLVYRRHATKVSGITSTEMERRISTASRQTGAKNEKETDLELYVHMYAVPSEVIRSNMYGSNCLEDNPAYLKPGVSSDCSGMDCGKSEEMLECGYAIIPPEKSLDCILDGNEEEPMYQEILPKAELMDSLSQPKEIPGSTVTAENDFYETVLHSQQLPQWKGDYNNVMTSGCPMPFQTFQHSEQ